MHVVSLLILYLPALLWQSYYSTLTCRGLVIYGGERFSLAYSMKEKLL